MPVPARHHSSDDIAVLPYRLVAHRVGLIGIDGECDESPSAP